MRAFIKTSESYVKTALVSMVAAASVFMLAATIHKLLGASGISGSGVRAFSSFMAILVFFLALAIVIELLSVETLVSYFGISALNSIKHNRKSRNRKLKKLKPNTQTRRPKLARSVSVEMHRSIELLLFKILGALLLVSSGIFLLVFLTQFMFSRFLEILVQGDRADEYHIDET